MPAAPGGPDRAKWNCSPGRRRRSPSNDRCRHPCLMTADIRRLIAPRSIVLIGAGAWTDAVAAGNAAVGYDGAIWRVHPTRTSTAAASYYRSVADLPAAPDAAFIAVPSH